MAKGEFQHNLWGIKDEELSGRWDWKNLRKSVKKFGVRNSLLVAPMPTASTSQILETMNVLNHTLQTFTPEEFCLESLL